MSLKIRASVQQEEGLRKVRETKDGKEEGEGDTSFFFFCFGSFGVMTYSRQVIHCLVDYTLMANALRELLRPEKRRDR